ncbi:MAG: glycine zipper 2TM domain-containing protein [Betaproteobacteria bacterium]|jgi:outer membrane lipoprotein SlyB|nr:glycine zipper 2TM domain-containing protein [Betaproteobacteria bacterium]
MSDTNKINPLVAIAAVAVTVFSLVGIGIMTGLVPSSFSRSSESALQTGAVDTKAANTATQTPAAAPAKPKAQAKPADATQPAKVATQAPVARVEQPKAAPVCANCGVIASVNAISQKGEGSGLGAVAGGVIGGVLGHQVGGGTGKKIATVAGAAGGAYAGHQVEKNMKSTTHYEVIVNMDDGNTRTFTYETQPAFQAGAKVRVVNGALTAG